MLLTVLILVLMEDALRESAQNLIGKVFDVLILVLMEDALRAYKTMLFAIARTS